MQSYEKCLTVEQEGYELITPYLDDYFDEYLTLKADNKSSFLKVFQKNYGDIVAKKDNLLVFIDIKVEKTNKYGNFFFETWSNKSRNTPGWFPKGGVKADLIYYIFLNKPEAFYVINLDLAREWSVKNIENYPEKPQQKYEQLNDSWGRCVKIEDCIIAGFAKERSL